MARSIDTERIYAAFTDEDSQLFAELESRRVSSHWNAMVRSPQAVTMKLRRCAYVFDQLNVASGSILDLGSGMGFLSGYMASRGADVVGVELVPQLRATAEYVAAQLFRTTRARFVASTNELERDSFDAVVMCNVVSHLDNLNRVLIDTAALVKPGGRLFVEDNNNRQSVLHRRAHRRQWLADDVGAARRRAAIDPGRENLSYGLSVEEIERWRGRDLGPLQRLREFAPYDLRNGMYHENWFTARELELLLFHSGFAPLEHRSKHVFDYRPHRLAAVVFRRVPRLSLYVAPAFELTAVRV